MFPNEFAAKGLVNSRNIERATLINPNNLAEEGIFLINDLTTRLRIDGHTLRTTPEVTNSERTSTGLFAVRSIRRRQETTSTAATSPEIRDGTYATGLSIYAEGAFTYTPDDSYDLGLVDARLLDGRSIRLPEAVLKIEDFNRDTPSTVIIRSSQFLPKR